MKYNNYIKKISKQRWDKESFRYTGYNFFCSSEWMSITSKVFIIKNYFYEISFNNKIIFLPIQKSGKRIYSNFVGYGGFLTNDKITVDELNEIIKITENKTGAKFIRIKFSPSSIINTLDIHKELTSIIKIDPFEKDECGVILSKDIRYIIRNIDKKNIAIRTLLPSEITRAHHLHKATMKRVGAMYNTPVELFKRISKSKNAYFLGAFNKGILHAASIFLYDKNVMYYWWNMSDMFGRKKHLNHLLIKEALVLAKKRGLQQFDMASSHTESLRIFKRSWGAKEMPFFLIEKCD